MPKVKVGDINMYYEVHGDGEPLVMIGGGGNTAGEYSKLIPLYSSECKLILFDNRGAGQSDAPDIPYTMEMLADDLAGLLDAIGIDVAHIQGTSLGGGVALMFALRYPERVTSLILTSTRCEEPYAVMPDAEFTKTLTAMPEMSPEVKAREYPRLFITREFANENPAIIQEIFERKAEHPSPSHGVRRQLKATSGPIYERLPEIKAPTLVIHGEADRAVPVENAKILASRIPNAELIIFKNAGHILIEAGEEPDRTLLDFLRRHSHKIKKGV